MLVRETSVVQMFVVGVVGVVESLIQIQSVQLRIGFVLIVQKKVTLIVCVD